MNLQEKIEDLRKRTLSDLLSVADEKTLNNLRTVMLGKKGELTEILKGMKDLTNEERPVIGALANAFRDEFGAKFEAKKVEIEQAVMNAALESETLDVTLPGKAQKKGSRHILTQTQEEIEELEKAVQEAPEKRLAQRRLAEEVTIFVHGAEALKEAENITEALYRGSIADLTKRELEQAFGKMPTVTVGPEEKAVVDWLVDTKICPSKRQAREDVQNGAITINGIKVTDLEEIVRPHKNSEGSYIIVRKGKKKYTLAKVEK